MGALGTRETITVTEAFARRGWTQEDVRRKLTNDRRRMHYRATAPAGHTDYTLHGGPLDRGTVSLTSTGTAPIEASGQVGRYVSLFKLRGLCPPVNGTLHPLVKAAEQHDREYRHNHGCAPYYDPPQLYWLPASLEQGETK